MLMHVCRCTRVYLPMCVCVCPCVCISVCVPCAHAYVSVCMYVCTPVFNTDEPGTCFCSFISQTVFQWNTVLNDVSGTLFKSQTLECFLKPKLYQGPWGGSCFSQGLVGAGMPPISCLRTNQPPLHHFWAWSGSLCLSDSVCLFLCLSVCLSLFLCFSVCLSLSLFSLFICLCLSLSLCVGV